MHPITWLLSDWYRLHQRALPWRDTTDPYIIWVSEVILQQTRVRQGLEYFLRFIEKWPDVHALAQAEDDEVLKMWQGLGYYTRARNLMAGARQVVNEFGGKVPSEYNELLKIKGIGRYTAAAIASIAFNKPIAVVDGNVLRVVSRLFAIKEPIDTPSGIRQVQQGAEALLDHANPGQHNQAMMEMGALVCLPRGPKCHICVIRYHCEAHKRNLQQHLPLKRPKNSVKVRWFNYFVIYLRQPGANEAIIIEKRQQDDIWKGLYHFPLIESQHELSPDDWPPSIRHLLDALGTWQLTNIQRAEPHLLSHQRIHATFYEIALQASVDFKLPNDLSLANAEQLNQKPFPRLIEWYLSKRYFNKQQ